MEPYTLDRSYQKQDVIDAFTSLIWTERYYGDGQVELTVPKTKEMYDKIPLGIFLGISESDEIMILETRESDNENGTWKYSGISILPWLNNRFVRTSARRQDRFWYLDHTANPTGNYTAGYILWEILFNMCSATSTILNGTVNIGITSPERLAIPGLSLKSYDTSGDKILRIAIPFAPLYDTMLELAKTYGVGMKIVLEDNLLKFQSFKGLDRTSRQSENSIIRFSSDLDSLTNVKEFQSIAAQKNIAWAWAPGIEDPGPSWEPPGTAGDIGGPAAAELDGFDLRALQVLADDITTADVYNGTEANLLAMLNERAKKGLGENPAIAVVDGEVVFTGQFKYGKDFFMGDLLEIKGDSGATSFSQVTEYIRSQDSAGESSYPTLARVE